MRKILEIKKTAANSLLQLSHLKIYNAYVKLFLRIFLRLQDFIKIRLLQSSSSSVYTCFPPSSVSLDEEDSTLSTIIYNTSPPN